MPMYFYLYQLNSCKIVIISRPPNNSPKQGWILFSY